MTVQRNGRTIFNNSIINTPTITGGSVNNTAANVTNLTVSGVANVTELATLSGGSTYGTPVSHAATESATAATLYGRTHLVTGAYTVTLPSVSVGMHGRFIATTAAVFSVDSTSPNYFVLSGTALDAGDKVTSDGSAGASFEWECTATNVITIIYSNSTFIDGGI